MQKQLAAKAAAIFIKEKMTIGIGTDSMAYYLIQVIGVRVVERIMFRDVATSETAHKKWEIFSTDNGNYIFDAKFEEKIE